MPDDPRAADRAAPYACKPHLSRGRRYPEAESATRTRFQRDRDRVIHSAAFRRLMHKTQVFVHHEGDHYRTRLTHSLEVAQIARSIARVLGLDEDLAEALSLAHDLGHTPFGHAGGDALDEAMAPWGGFDHNAQTLRIVTRLEARYAAFDGLNLTWETLEGLVKHNGPLAADAVPAAIAEYVAEHDLELDSFAGAEAQVAAIADDIAYNNHDIDDGLRARLFTVDDLAGVPLAGPIFAEIAEHHPALDEARLIHESVRRMIDAMVNDVIAETRRRVSRARPESADAVRRLGRPLVAFSDEMRGHDRALKAFLGENMYRHDRVTRITDVVQPVVRELFTAFMADAGQLPADWRERAAGATEPRRARLVADYIAGMTDRFAIAEYDRVFNTSLSLK
ncbi:MAG: deoxyguanosinetriphosphate triphosphohydrolase [Proteobacteria bacterium]|nr:deoxyguanosinetriphosphate triphosphohydrolase [Pseudomonadota bacterium]